MTTDIRPRALVGSHVAEHLAGGYPELTLDRVVDLQGTLVPGALVDLTGPEDTRIGIGIWDGENERIRVCELGAQASFAPETTVALVERAWARRVDAGLPEQADAWRVVNGVGDGIPGVVADVYGAFVVITLASRSLELIGQRVRGVLAAKLAPRGILTKIHGGRGGTKVELSVQGAMPPRRLVVHEGTLAFEVHLGGGVNTGLFTDLRDERRLLGAQATGKRVLSTFAYTGTLATAMLSGGAASVTLVDLAGGMKSWRERNLALNGVAAGDPRVKDVEADVLESLAAMIARNEGFDTVLLDPPTYSAARPSAWTLKRHLPLLVERGARVVAPAGGELWLAINARGMRRPACERLVQEGLTASGRAATIVDRRGLPLDYPTLAVLPRSEYLKIFAIRVAPR